MWAVLRDILSFESFTSIWYWIFLALGWNSLSHWTLGVPFDAVIRADRRGGAFEDHVDTVAHAMAERLIYVMNMAGPYIIGIGVFAMTALASMAFWLRLELAQAMFVFLFPLMVVTGKDVYFAYRISAQNLRGKELRRSLFWQRFLTQIAGMTSLVAAAIFLTQKLLSTKPYLFHPI